jgi:hypothetical protein
MFQWSWREGIVHFRQAKVLILCADLSPFRICRVQPRHSANFCRESRILEILVQLPGFRPIAPPNLPIIRAFVESAALS